MKALLKTLVRGAGFVAVRRTHPGARYVEFPPRGPFDEILLRVFPDLGGLRFIQVGANDGVLADPIFRYIAPCSWEGVLVEPMPEPFARLKALYDGNSRLTLLNAAVDDEVGQREIFHLKDGLEQLPGWAAGLPSLHASRLAQAADALGLPSEAVTSTTVATIRWDDVWNAFGSKQCDLLVTDTEGYDIRLLRNCGLREHRPTVILFEHACVEEPERWAFCRELADIGYELATSAGDTIAWRPNSGAVPS